MAIAPADGQAFAKQVRAIYDNAERLILEKIAKRVSKGGVELDPDHWLEQKLNEVRRQQAEIDKITSALRTKGDKAINDLVVQAYLSGVMSADSDLIGYGIDLEHDPIKVPLGAKGSDLSKVVATFGATHTSAIASIASEALGGLKGAHMQLARQARDKYRDIIMEVTQGAVAGVDTRKQAIQKALNKFADEGIGVFVDKAGRNWDISTYAEMATRTGMAHAHIQGHINRMTQQGRDLVIVSNHPEESDLCRPHEGKIYSISGTHPTFKSLAWARENGLFHPNCRHTINAYIEGLSEVPEVEGDPEGYKLRQKQRHLEKQVRHWKKRQVVAVNPRDKRIADAKVKEWSLYLKQFMKQHKRKREYDHEKIDTRLIGKGPIGHGTPSPNIGAEIKSMDELADIGAKTLKADSDALTPPVGTIIKKPPSKMTIADREQIASASEWHKVGIDTANKLDKADQKLVWGHINRSEAFDTWEQDLQVKFSGVIDPTKRSLFGLGEDIMESAPMPDIPVASDELMDIVDQAKDGMDMWSIIMDRSSSDLARELRTFSDRHEGSTIERMGKVYEELSTVPRIPKPKIVKLEVEPEVKAIPKPEVTDPVESDTGEIWNRGMTDDEQDVVGEFMSGWSGSSTDDIGIEFRVVAHEMRPNTDIDAFIEAMEDSMADMIDEDEIMEMMDNIRTMFEDGAPAKSVKAVEKLYNTTQEHLSRMYPDGKVKLYRGVQLTSSDRRKISSGRGATYAHSPLESWTTDPDVAKGFGDTVIVEEFSIKDILVSHDMMSGTEWLDPDEYEFIVMPPRATMNLKKDTTVLDPKSKVKRIDPEPPMSANPEISATIEEAPKVDFKPSDDLIMAFRDMDDVDDVRMWLDDELADEFNYWADEFGSSQDLFDAMQEVIQLADRTPEEVWYDNMKESANPWEKQNFVITPNQGTITNRRAFAKIDAQGYARTHGYKDRNGDIDWDTYFKDTAHKLEELMTDAIPTIRVSPQVAKMVIDGDGRIKTQFETGTSNGMFAPDARASVENRLFGAPKNMTPKDRPIYGLMDAPHGQTSQGNRYGSIKLRLRKDAVKDRMSITIGDSLDYDAPALRPHNLDTTMVGSDILGAEDITQIHERSYTELQVFGGVSASDVEFLDVSMFDVDGPYEVEYLRKWENAGVTVRIWDTVDTDGGSRNTPKWTTLQRFVDNDYDIDS